MPPPFECSTAPSGAGVEVAEPEADTTARPAPLYKVLLDNDDVTPMDFVCHVLARVFGKTFEEAFAVMMEAHTKGIALVEVVPLEVAEHHVDQARSLARARKYPLRFDIEAA